ncbi:MAG TPA: hypothetical protein VJT73_00770 [Polyangiaceae bacterium]|nr:hypothetical protein [Polyangiaceae bacterium]
MLVGELPGWREAVERARELWPSIPAWAFERAAELEAEARTHEQAERFALHPATAAELAVRAGALHGRNAWVLDDEEED